MNVPTDTNGRKPLLVRIFNFYVEGFKSMTIGKTLWAIILIKIFIFFVIMKTFFFPNFLNSNYDNDADKAQHVRTELLNDKR